MASDLPTLIAKLAGRATVSAESPATVGDLHALAVIVAAIVRMDSWTVAAVLTRAFEAGAEHPRLWKPNTKGVAAP